MQFREAQFSHTKDFLANSYNYQQLCNSLDVEMRKRLENVVGLVFTQGFNAGVAHEYQSGK